MYLNSTLVINCNVNRIISIQYDFWKEPTDLGDTADIMIKEPLLDDFKAQLNKYNFNYTTIIDDVQK